ncbi:MAG: fatty acyl-AMP ligase, partial [Candidatus Angelobacter sp.]
MDKSLLICRTGGLAGLLQSRAESQPGRTAYSFIAEDDRCSSFSYQQLDRRARAVAARLQAHRAAGERVLVLYPPGLSYVTAFFACLYAGAIAVPAYPPHHSRNMVRLRTIIADAEPRIALVPRQTQKWLQSLGPDSKGSQMSLLDVEDDDHAGWKEPVFAPEHPAFIQYTSGSTGTPRGVVLTHQNLINNSTLIEKVFGYDEDAHCVSWLPAYHDMGLIGGILQPLFGGYPCTMMSSVSFLRRPVRWLQEISRHQNVISGGPDFAYRLCAEKVSEEERLQLDLSSWQVAFNGAETVRAETLRRFAEVFGQSGFRAEAFLPCYGLAEATLMVSGCKRGTAAILKKVKAAELEAHRWAEDEAGGSQRTLVSSGTISDQSVAIVHPDSMLRCGPDEIGEIWLRSASVARGYWQRKMETAATFGARLKDTGE